MKPKRKPGRLMWAVPFAASPPLSVFASLRKYGASEICQTRRLAASVCPIGIRPVRVRVILRKP